MQEVKIAVLGNYATQFTCKSIEKAFKKKGCKAILYNADFNAIDFEIIDENSGLYKFEPSYLVWHESTLGLRDLFYQTSVNDRSCFAKNYIEKIETYIGRIRQILPNTVILFPNHGLIFNDNIFGNFAAKVDSSWLFQVVKLNALVNEVSVRNDSFYVFDSVNQELYGRHTDYSQVVNAELHFTPPYLDWLAESIAKFVLTISGKFKKCVILDLDNTLWGGIIGDDGLEGIQIGSLGIGKAFTRFQKWLKELKNRGVVLAVCSKNNLEVAQQPFRSHSDMILSLDDIAVFIANWDSKADNINTIREILNIGFDSMVFLDDNPAERDIVRKHLPDVEVPEMPEDPAEYVPFLIAQNIFETSSYSTNDSERTQQYQIEALRVEMSKSITDMSVFLTSLNMRAEVRSFRKEDVDRVAQLTQRSNQFNLRTIRYTSSEINSMIENKEYCTFCVEVNDKFGSYGLISVGIIKLLGGGVAFIDTWIMSCRVLKRTVEHYLMNTIVGYLKEKNIEKLEGEYLSTIKNSLVENLLDELGMEKTNENKYELYLDKHVKLKTYINL